MTNKSLHEISRYSFIINKNEEPLFSRHNHILTMGCQKGLTLLKFSYNMQCMDKKIDCIITDIACPKTSPATKLFSKKFTAKSISNFDFTQLVVNPSLWPHNVHYMEELATIVAFEWSPSSVILNTECVVAGVNNIGNIELYGLGNSGFRSVLNISSLIAESIKSDLPHNVEELKQCADAVETSAVCWGSHNEDTVNFVTAQKNGDIYFWQLNFSIDAIKVKAVSVYQSNCDEIVKILWIPFSNEKFLIIFANVHGLIFAYQYEWENDEPKILKTECLWRHKDRMIVKHLRYLVEGDKIILICSKHRHLLVFMIDYNCHKIHEYVNNVNDHRITVISEHRNQFYLGTINCKAYKINLTIMAKSVDVNLVPIAIQENLTNKDLYGIYFTENNVACVGLVDRKIMCRKENLMAEIVFLCPETSHEKDIMCLINNPTRKLTEYWDCIQVIRYKVMKLKILPAFDYNKLYTNGNKDLYIMKVYYVVLKLYHNLEKILKNNSKGWLPEDSLEVVRDRILALNACSLFTNLYEKSQKGTNLVGLELETLMSTRNYLKYYSCKYKQDLTELVSLDALNSVKVDYTYTCQCCEEKINGFSCTQGHLNMFCALTLTLIEADNYHFCKGCGVMARIELLHDKPMCLFCDIYLSRC